MPQIRLISKRKKLPTFVFCELRFFPTVVIYPVLPAHTIVAAAALVVEPRFRTAGVAFSA